MCLPSAYLTSLHKAFPLRVCILQAIKKLEVGTAWERGYMVVQDYRLVSGA